MSETRPSPLNHPGGNRFRPYLIRLGFILLLSFALSFLINELTFRLLKQGIDRAPQTFQLVIPPGTASRVSAGEPINDIPDEMLFVVGDVLEVKNEDVVPHELGPLLIPPASTSRLVMSREDKLAYSCSFQTSQYFGLDVLPATTIGTRIAGVAVAGPTLAALIFVYSLAIRPIGEKESNSKNVSEKLT